MRRNANIASNKDLGTLELNFPGPIFRVELESGPRFDLRRTVIEVEAETCAIEAESDPQRLKVTRRGDPQAEVTHRGDPQR